MFKKKNIAMMMAAATVATSVAPAFASTIDVQKVDEATMIAKVEELLAVKYSNSAESGGEGTIQSGEEYKNSVYEIYASNTDRTRINNIATLKSVIEEAKVEGEDLTLEVTDKGHKEVNGEIVATETTAYSYYEDVRAEIFTVELAKVGAELNLDEATEESAIITLANGNEIELLRGDYVLDLSKPVDANGNLIDVTDALDAATQRKVTGFKLLEAKPEKKDIASKRVMDLTMTSNIEVEENLSDLYVHGKGYTKKGATIVNFVKKAQADDATYVYNGVEYNIGNVIVGAVKSTKTGYELTVNMGVVKSSTVLEDAIQNLTITISSDSQADLTKVMNEMKDTENVVVAGNYTELSGDDRFQTAVAVSEKTYASLKEDTTSENSRKEAKAIVLVGEEAIVDGLAAAPLAAQENAPILLTKKDTVPTDTLNEIKRIAKKGTKVYLVGGEANISKEVEKELISEINAEIVRVAGEDRFETSLEIAELLDTKKDAFVVGGDGLADAMSIAAIAANKDNIKPILVTPESGLTKDTKNFIEDNVSNVTVVGGEARVSTQVLKDIKEITNATPTRIAGETRSETNAKVIDEYASSLEKVYVAKDGDNQLVDALAAAPLAGANNGVIVLATDDLSSEQSKAIKQNLSGKVANYELTQVGGGVGTTVIEKLIKLLGL